MIRESLRADDTEKTLANNLYKHQVLKAASTRGRVLMWVFGVLAVSAFLLSVGFFIT
jgi:ethanolamine transporter EutH